ALLPVVVAPGVAGPGLAVGVDPNDVQVGRPAHLGLDAELVAGLQRQHARVEQRQTAAFLIGWVPEPDVEVALPWRRRHDRRRRARRGRGRGVQGSAGPAAWPLPA